MFIETMTRKMRDGDSAPISGPWGSRSFATVVDGIDRSTYGEPENMDPRSEEKTQCAAAVEKPTLPFSRDGRLIGERRYGDHVINVRKPLQVVVIGDGVPTMVLAAGPVSDLAPLVSVTEPVVVSVTEPTLDLAAPPPAGSSCILL